MYLGLYYIVKCQTLEEFDFSECIRVHEKWVKPPSSVIIQPEFMLRYPKEPSL